MESAKDAAAAVEAIEGCRRTEHQQRADRIEMMEKGGKRHEAKAVKGSEELQIRSCRFKPT